MKGVGFATFLGISAAVHVALLLSFVGSPGEGGEPEGVANVTLVSMPEAAALVAAWKAPPVVAEMAEAPAPPGSEAGPDAPQVAEAAPERVNQVLTAPAAGEVALPDTAPPEPMPVRKTYTRAEVDPTLAMPPEKPVSRANAGAAPVAASRAKGDAGGLSSGQRAAIQAAWAREIRDRIARAQRHPGRRFGSGKVPISMTILESGALREARLTGTSGSPALDRAALEAVRRAAPFPPAPKGLGDSWYSVRQVIAFAAR